MKTDLITEVKSAIAIPKNSPFTQARPPEAAPSGVLLCVETHMVICLRAGISSCPIIIPVYFLSVLAGFTRNRLINSAMI